MLSELVYLSDAKLRQFLPLSGGQFGGRLRGLKASLKLTTPLVSVDVSPSADGERARLDRFRQVAAQVERDAAWFGEDRHPPGRWIFFEAPLNHMLLAEPFDHMVVFLDPRDPVDGYDPGSADDAAPAPEEG